MSVVAWCIILSFVLLLCGVPVALSLLSGVGIYFAFGTNSPSLIMAQQFVSGVESIPLLAIPFFICAGIMMNYSSITRRIMDFCVLLTRRCYGGLGMVNVLLSTLMGGMSGSNLADAAMEAKVLVPEMERVGYPKSFSAAVTAVTSIITPLIPPSIGAIVYGSIAGISIGKLFVAGLTPGLLLCITMLVMVNRISKKKGYQAPATEPLKKGELGKAFLRALPPLFLPIIIIGSIRLGLCTPTEAGAVSIAYALFLGLCYRELDIKRILSVLKDTFCTTANTLLIVGAAAAFGWMLTKEGIPAAVSNFMLQFVSSKWVFLIVVNVLLLVLGCFMEGTAIMLILIPILTPIASSYGFEPLHFAVIFLFNLGIGCLTPPLGTVMFVTCNITKCKTKDFVVACVPFYLLMIVVLFSLSAFESLSLFFVNLLW